MTRWGLSSLAARAPWRHSPAAGSPGGAGHDADPLVHALQRHAHETLSPDPESLARMRSELLAAFDAAAVAGSDTASPGRAGRGWIAPAGQPLRVRAAALVAAAAVLAGGAGAAFAASGPGGPLYTTRLDIEALTLPPAGTPAWFNAEVERLGARLSEVESATKADNTPAVEAAAQAYEAVLSQTVAASSRTATGSGSAASPAAVPPGLARALDRHEAVLSSLLERAPAAAQPALRTALGQVGKAAAAGMPEPSKPGVATEPQATPSKPGHAGNPPGQNRTHPPAGLTETPGQGNGSGGAPAAPAAAASPQAWSGNIRLAASIVDRVATHGASRATGHGRDHSPGRHLVPAGSSVARPTAR